MMTNNGRKWTISISWIGTGCIVAANVLVVCFVADFNALHCPLKDKPDTQKMPEIQLSQQ